MRPYKTLLAEAHVGERHAINRDAGFDIGVRGVDLLKLSLWLKGLEEITRLITERVPILVSKRDVDFEAPDPSGKNVIELQCLQARTAMLLSGRFY